MAKTKKQHRSYDDNFKLTVLKDMYENNLSAYAICQKYGILAHQTIRMWEKVFRRNRQTLWGRS